MDRGSEPVRGSPSQPVLPPIDADRRGAEAPTPLGLVDRVVHGAILLHRHDGRSCRFGDPMAADNAGWLIAGDFFRCAGRSARRHLALFQYRLDKRHGQTFLRCKRRLIELIQQREQRTSTPIDARNQILTGSVR